jgi:hypothetical protein
LPVPEFPTGKRKHSTRHRTNPPPNIDKNVLPIGEARRYRDKAHLEFIASQPCLVCGRRPTDPHHLRFAQNRALGRKVSDEFTVPLCRLHHRQAHRSRNERLWWQRLGLDSVKIAAMLWRKTRQPFSSTRGGAERVVVNGDTGVASLGLSASEAPPPSDPQLDAL